MTQTFKPCPHNRIVKECDYKLQNFCFITMLDGDRATATCTDITAIAARLTETEKEEAAPAV